MPVIKLAEQKLCLVAGVEQTALFLGGEKVWEKASAPPVSAQIDYIPTGSDSVPPEWQSRWAPMPYAVNSAGDRLLYGPNPVSYKRGALFFNPAGQITGPVRCYARFGINLSNGADIFGLVVAASGTTEAERTGYYLWIRDKTTLGKALNGAESVYSTGSEPTGPVDMNAELFFDGISKVEARYWVQGNSRPVAPTFSRVDTSPLSGGYAGLINISRDATPAIAISRFSVTTDGSEIVL